MSNGDMPGQNQPEKGAGEKQTEKRIEKDSLRQTNYTPPRDAAAWDKIEKTTQRSDKSTAESQPNADVRRFGTVENALRAILQREGRKVDASKIKSLAEAAMGPSPYAVGEPADDYMEQAKEALRSAGLLFNDQYVQVLSSAIRHDSQRERAGADSDQYERIRQPGEAHFVDFKYLQGSLPDAANKAQDDLNELSPFEPTFNILRFLKDHIDLVATRDPGKPPLEVSIHSGSKIPREGNFLLDQLREIVVDKEIEKALEGTVAEIGAKLLALYGPIKTIAEIAEDREMEKMMSQNTPAAREWRERKKLEIAAEIVAKAQNFEMDARPKTQWILQTKYLEYEKASNEFYKYVQMNAIKGPRGRDLLQPRVGPADNR